MFYFVFVVFIVMFLCISERKIKKPKSLSTRTWLIVAPDLQEWLIKLCFAFCFVSWEKTVMCEYAQKCVTITCWCLHAKHKKIRNFFLMCLICQFSFALDFYLLTFCYIMRNLLCFPIEIFGFHLLCLNKLTPKTIQKWSQSYLPTQIWQMQLGLNQCKHLKIIIGKL